MYKNRASDQIIAAHRRASEELPFEDRTDFENAQRGFISKLSPAVVRDNNGEIVWDGESYNFLSAEAPDTVHPSLWRQSQLTNMQGLFQVVEGIYQVRGLDLSSITFVEGDTGVIVIDPLTCIETARAALGLYREHRGDRPIKAVIYTHSHVDHFGGVRGVISQEEVDRGEVEVIAPAGFIEHAIAENIYAGTTMARRASYMYGAALDRGPLGQVGTGLGQTVPTGTISLIAPTIDISESLDQLTIDGISIEFQLTPNSEAPAEMHFFFPRYRALCLAENATHTMHNLLTLRGALVRDPRLWSRYLTETMELFGDRTEVAFASHHWPTWGRQEALDFISTQRDMYGYLHDQTVRQMNRGLTGTEIAEGFEFPPALDQAWNARGYYGSVSHNVKAIYQRYMGWFDGNPARLWRHTPHVEAVKYVAAMGGITQVLNLAQEAFDAGDFRWAATLLDHAIFCEPDNSAVPELLAAVFTQLGYGSENGTWRNFFLAGAHELLRENFGTPTTAHSEDLLSKLTPEQIFDVIAIQIDGPRAWDLDIAIDWHFTDTQRVFRTRLRNGLLTYVENPRGSASATAITTTQQALPMLLMGGLESLDAVITGDPSELHSILGVLQPGDPDFNIVTP